MPGIPGRIPASAAPILFVLLWSSGFIGARLGLPYAEPMTFLSIRMIAVVTLLGLLILATRPAWPSAAGALHSVVVGLLMHGCYLGGVFVAIDHRLPTGLAALVVSLQPILTATMANRLLGERVAARQWAGLLLGVAGVYLVVQSRTVGETSAAAWIAITVALVGITIGTLYQKRFGAGIDWRTGFLFQYAGAGTRVRPRRAPARAAQRAMVGRASARARLARARDVVRRRVAALFPDQALGGRARRQPVLSHAAGDGADGLGLVRRAARAAVPRRHGGVRRRRLPGELADRIRPARRVSRPRPTSSTSLWPKPRVLSISTKRSTSSR